MKALSAEDVLCAYSCGYFPMADSAAAENFSFYDPDTRAQLPILDLHIPARLRRTVLNGPYEVKINSAFEHVIDECAADTKKRPQTWINRGIRDIFIQLHKMGYAHSVECWHNGALAGGLYGLAIGGFFSGESMFSRHRDASKIALVHLCARLWRGGFSVLDAQFMNDHLRQFGAYEISRDEYLKRLKPALTLPADFNFIETNRVSEASLIASYLIENKR